MHRQTSSPRSTTSQTVEASQPRLLVVDDETLLSWSIANALTKAGYQVVVLDSGEKAMVYLRTHAVDLLLTDVELPALSGYELASAVRSQHPSVPIILMSATEDEAIAQNTSSFDQFVEKPFSMKEIVTLVDKLLLNVSKTAHSRRNQVN